MSEYLDGEMDDRRRSRMERHVRDCPECEELMRSLGQVVTTLGSLRVEDGERSVAGAVLAQVQDELTADRGSSP